MRRFLLAAWLTCAAPPPLSAADLAIVVRGMETASGSVQYAVYDSARYFPTREGRIAKGRVPAKGDAVRIVVSGLKPGFYAVAVYHDENDNDEFDRGLFGFPLETYGFSNDARGFFSAPDFDSARFELDEPGSEITITLGR